MKPFSLKNTSRSGTTAPVFSWLIFGVVALAVVGLPLLREGSRMFAPEEDWAVSWSLYQQVQAGLPSLIVQNLVRYASDNILFDLWLRQFDPSEALALRYFSALCLMIGLACLFRLASDFWNRRTALLAVALLGILSVFQFYGTQTLPYSASLMAATGLHLTFWRWRRCPSSWRRAGLYALLAFLLINTYPFAVSLIAVQAVVFVLLAGWPCERTLPVFIFGITGLVAVVRVLAASVPIVMDTYWRALDELALALPILPLQFVQGMLLLGLAVAAGMMVSPASRPVRYLLVVTVVLAVSMFAGRGGWLRLFFPLLPLLVLLAAYTLSLLRWPVRLAVLAVYLLPVSLTSLTSPTGVTYQETVDLLLADAGSKTVIAAPYLWQHLPYENDRLSPFHIVSPGQESAFPTERSTSNQTADEHLRAFVADSEIVWFVENGDTGLNDWYKNVLAQDYGISRIIEDTYAPMYAYDTITRFLHIPDDIHDIFVFRDDSFDSRFILKSWTLLDSVTVQPCQPVRLRSWWQGESPVDVSLTLVIVDGVTGQGIANTDGPPIAQPAYTMQPDWLYADERSVNLPCDAVSGEYPLMLGFYRLDGSAVVPLAASLPDDTPLGSLAYLTTLFVK